MRTPETTDKMLYTPIEAAQALGVSRSTIYVLMASGDIPSVRIGACRRVPVEGLRHYISRLTGRASKNASTSQRRSVEVQSNLWG